MSVNCMRDTPFLLTMSPYAPISLLKFVHGFQTAPQKVYGKLLLCYFPYYI